ncbi:hypothetical protein GR160_17405 [Flavobacterium sp. Sd200]|uniref:hypothetical protein n=1 Tax=Flavobacterium sp. Sd200 TaxID=2692211 RepID=UPI00136DF98D|nr:hypothetical protein [Flavobacterium sp. Sd200]MXN93006.1 hypothetical protein [Flavobacterium sp. Sd200]
MNKQLIIAGFAVLAMASCKKDTPATPPAPPTPPPVQDPAPPKAPEPRVQATAPDTTEKDGTSISLDQNGISIKDKEGKESKTITVSKTKKEVKINTD